MNLRKIGKIILDVGAKAFDSYIEEGKAANTRERQKDMTLREVEEERQSKAREERGQDKSRERRAMDQTVKTRKDQHKKARQWLVDNQNDKPDFLARIIREKPRPDPYAEVARDMLHSLSCRGDEAASAAMKELKENHLW